MKITFLAFILAAFSTIVSGQDSLAHQKPLLSNPGYCAALEKGKVVIKQNGKPIKNDIVLKNGNTITVSGTIIKKDGAIQAIKPGTCVDAEGNAIEEADKK